MTSQFAVHAITRPAASQPEDIQEYEDAMNEETNVIGYDVRMTRVLGFMTTVFGLVTVAAICWGTAALVGLKQDVAVLLSRPEGVSKAEYERDARRWDEQIEQIKRYQEEQEIRNGTRGK